MPYLRLDLPESHRANLNVSAMLRRTLPLMSEALSVPEERIKTVITSSERCFVGANEHPLAAATLQVMDGRERSRLSALAVALFDSLKAELSRSAPEIDLSVYIVEVDKGCVATARWANGAPRSC